MNEKDGAAIILGLCVTMFLFLIMGCFELLAEHTLIAVWNMYEEMVGLFFVSLFLFTFGTRAALD
jgi:hypothetical protein